MDAVAKPVLQANATATTLIRRKGMDRRGAFAALAIAVLVGLVFGIFPELDLWVTARFVDPAADDLGVNWDLLYWLRTAASWLIALIAAPAFLALIVKFVMPRRPMLVPARGAVLMVVTLLLGPGLLTNTLLKDNWGRPRPLAVTQFGGELQFRPWWDPRGACAKNCSFVAGEPSGAFWTLAPAALTPPRWRAAAYGAALTFGTLVGIVRIAGGGHFFSDFVFGGLLTFMIIWLMHGLIYRWRPTRFDDARVERITEKEAMRWRGALGWIADRIRKKGAKG